MVRETILKTPSKEKRLAKSMNMRQAATMECGHVEEV
jgi:hypothetical protein